MIIETSKSLERKLEFLSRMETENILAALIDLAEHQAKMVLMELREPMVPSWVIVTKDHRVLVRGTAWKDNREKELAARYIREQLRKHEALAYSFLMEAWMAPAPEGWQPGQPLAKHEHATERADRREMVIAFATDGKETKWAAWEISRNWKGDCDKLVAQPPIGHGLAESWMTELL